MKMFTKLALVSSIAISANAMAMQAMDDADLSATTGQAGITVTIDVPTAITIQKLYIHDNDGVAAFVAEQPGPPVVPASGAVGGTGQAGAIRIGSSTSTGISISKLAGATGPLATLVIDTDAGTNGNPFLNVKASLQATKIDIGSISVVGSNGNAAPATGVVRGEAAGSTAAEILTGLSITTGAVSANIQLGNSPQGAMIKLDSEFTGGLNISNLGIKDNAGGGQVNFGEIRVADAPDASGVSSGNLTADASIKITSTGLEIKPVESANGTSIYVKDVKFAAASATDLTNSPSIGDIEVVGLKTGGSTITISGH